MESIIACRIITVISSFTQLFAIFCFVQGVPRFTREPPSVLYASSGSTARLVWDYNVKNRTEVFDPLSPEWNFYNKTGSRLRIGVDNGYSKWKFVINEECPTRLRGRVSRESPATLVISNVTTADSGIYGCYLLVLSRSPIKSRVHLIVTDRPRFNNTFNLTTFVIEGSSLHVHCSASANPVPNVTWVRIMELPIFFNTGVGRVFLRFSNITRHQSGSYECQATNNPNEDPVTTRTKISVKFPVQPANVSVSDIKMVSAVIKWLRPIDDIGCPVMEYKIQIEEITTLKKNIIITNTTIRQLYAVQDLTENTTYGVKVYARNAVGYGKAVCVEFTTKAAKTSTLNERLGAIDGAKRQKVFAGVIGVVIWVGLMGTVVLLVCIKKRCSRRGNGQENIRSKSNKTFINDDMTQPRTFCKQDTPSQEISEEKENSEPQPFPFYAKVDTRKKRRPGEIVYAELEQMQTKAEDAPVAASNYFPQRYQETQYADIEH